MSAHSPTEDFACGYTVQDGMVASVKGDIIWTMSPKTALELRKVHLLNARTHRDDYRRERRYLPRHMWRASLTYAAELGRALRRIEHGVH